MLELKNVSKIYKTDDFVQKAVDDVSIKFNYGELTAILGESGCGKSTLLNLLSGLDKPSSGKVIIDGIDTSRFNKKEWATYRNHYVGFVFQEYNLIENLTAVENVELPLLLQGVNPKEARKKALEKIELVGLSNHSSKLPVQLSGGQKQRISIARALVTDPKIIMADEPTGALDYELGLKTINFIKKACPDKIIILVTHDVEIATRFADRILQMKDGKIISDSKEILEDENNKDDFSLKKPKMNLRMSARLAKKNMFSKVKRTILTSLTVSIGLVCIFILVFLTTGINSLLNGVLAEILPTNVYNVEGMYSNQVLTDDDILKISNIDNVSEVVPYYLETVSTKNEYLSYSITNIPNKKENSEFRKIYGSYPENKNDVLLSIDTLNSIMDDYSTKESDILYKLERVKSLNVTFKNDSDISLNVVGAVDSKLDLTNIFAKTELLKENSTSDVTRLNVYLINNSEKKCEDFERSVEALNFSVINVYKELTKEISGFFNKALRIMIFAAIGSLAVAGILIALIIYTSVVERTKEIGILNALGASGRNIALIFVIEAMFIGIAAVIFGFLISFLLSKIGNGMFTNIIQGLVDTLIPNNSVNVNVFKINVLWTLAISLICILYTMIIGLLPASKAARMNAVNALRKE